MQAKILGADQAVRGGFAVEGPLQDDQHQKGAADAQLNRRCAERDDDAGDVWNHQVGHETHAAEEDLELVDTSVDQHERGEDLVGRLWANVLKGEASDGLEGVHDGSGRGLEL